MKVNQEGSLGPLFLLQVIHPLPVQASEKKFANTANNLFLHS
jgi:hypothetical protein